MKVGVSPLNNVRTEAIESAVIGQLISLSGRSPYKDSKYGQFAPFALLVSVGGSDQFTLGECLDELGRRKLGSGSTERGDRMDVPVEIPDDVDELKGLVSDAEDFLRREEERRLWRDVLMEMLRQGLVLKASVGRADDALTMFRERFA